MRDVRVMPGGFVIAGFVVFGCQVMVRAACSWCSAALR
jgi:hypothetical protein